MNTTDTKHTPTPWELNKSGEVVIRWGTGGNYAVLLADEFYDNQLEDAAFIVRAVNAHERLLMLAKDYLNLLISDYEGQNGKDLTGGLIKKTKEIIAQEDGR